MEAKTSQRYPFESGVGISEIDINGEIIYVNRVFCEITGYAKDELLGKKYDLIRHPDMPNEVFEKLHKAIEGAQTYRGTLKNLRKDGSYYWSDIEVLTIYDQDEKISGYATISRAASRSNIEEFEHQNRHIV